MCELLAMSSSQPARLTFSLHALASHGRKDDSSRDGWGVAFYQGNDIALFREPGAAGDSGLVRYLERYGPSTNLAVSHIRHATQGQISLANTQPVVRELGGRMQLFAHNGDLHGVGDLNARSIGSFHSVGNTDSELAFCILLNRLAALWSRGEVPSLDSRMRLISTFADELRKLGPANFFYADADTLFVHAHRRIQSHSKRIEPPGLWMVERHCNEPVVAAADGAGISLSNAYGCALLFASVPLTDENWLPLGEGDLLAVRAGQVLDRRRLQQPTIHAVID